MTKRILMALALVAGMAGAASAQDASVTVTATVAPVMAYNGVQRALTFPTATPGSGDVIVDETYVTPAGGAQLGYAQFEINLSGVDLQVTAPASLTADDGVSPALPITIQCAEGATTGVGIALGPCATHALTYGGTGVETRALWLGGVIYDTDLTAATAGGYTGTIDILIVP